MAEVVVSLEALLALQEKTNNSLRPVGRTIFGRMVDMFPFPSNGENSAHSDSKLSSNGKGKSRNASNTVEPENSMFLDTREVPADCRIPSPNLEEFKFADLRRATRNFSLGRLLGERSFGQVFLGWVDKNTFAPSRRGVGIAVAVKRLSQTSFQGRAEWLAEDFNAKLGDLGFARSGPEIGNTHVTTRVMGSGGCGGPEYICTGHLSVKSDIYSFGGVLLETLTGLRARDAMQHDEQHSLVHWASLILTKRSQLKKIMDPRLEQNYPLEGAFKCAALAVRCLADKPNERPSSEEVLQRLEQIYATDNGRTSLHTTIHKC